MSKSKFDFLRPLTDEEYTGLKASIVDGGQISPIVRDQNGATLDGHHRERALTELGVPETEWKIEIRSFATDQERFTFVHDANLHRRQSSAEDRKHNAKRLADLGLTQQEIAEVLRVSQPTIARDLDGFLFTVNKFPPREEKRGRPKGSRLPPKPIDAPAARTAPTGKIAEPPIDPATLSLTARQKLEAHKRKLDKENEEYKRRLERENEERFRAEQLRRDQIWLDHEMEEFKKAAQRNRLYKGHITKAQYRDLQRCLHTDVLDGIAKQGAVDPVTRKRFDHALGIINDLAAVLLKDENEPPPVNRQELWERMARGRARRDAENRERAQRAAATRKANAAKQARTDEPAP